jgi:hypothetical protein
MCQRHHRCPFFATKRRASSLAPQPKSALPDQPTPLDMLPPAQRPQPRRGARRCQGAKHGVINVDFDDLVMPQHVTKLAALASGKVRRKRHGARFAGPACVAIRIARSRPRRPDDGKEGTQRPPHRKLSVSREDKSVRRLGNAEQSDICQRSAGHRCCGAKRNCLRRKLSRTKRARALRPAGQRSEMVTAGARLLRWTPPPPKWVKRHLLGETVPAGQMSRKAPVDNVPGRRGRQFKRDVRLVHPRPRGTSLNRAADTRLTAFFSAAVPDTLLPQDVGDRGPARGTAAAPEERQFGRTRCSCCRAATRHAS